MDGPGERCPRESDWPDVARDGGESEGHLTTETPPVGLDRDASRRVRRVQLTSRDEEERLRRARSGLATLLRALEVLTRVDGRENSPRGASEARDEATPMTRCMHSALVRLLTAPCQTGKAWRLSLTRLAAMFALVCLRSPSPLRRHIQVSCVFDGVNADCVESDSRRGMSLLLPRLALLFVWRGLHGRVTGLTCGAARPASAAAACSSPASPTPAGSISQAPRVRSGPLVRRARASPDAGDPTDFALEPLTLACPPSPLTAAAFSVCALVANLPPSSCTLSPRLA